MEESRDKLELCSQGMIVLCVGSGFPGKLVYMQGRRGSRN